MTISWQWPQDRITIIDFIREGGVIAYPTEAVYGLGGDPFNDDVVSKILAYKRTRDPAKGLVLVADDWHTFAEIIEPLSYSDIEEMNQLNIERATTFIVNATDKVHEGLTDQNTGRIAVRVSKHPIIIALSKALAMPIISTSANYSGCLPAKTPAEVRSYFANVPIVVGALGSQQRPSRIIDWHSKEILRD